MATRKCTLNQKYTEATLNSIKHSVSFRIGRFITWAPREVRGAVQCYRDNGAGYTVRRTLYHIGLWKDEEKG